MTRPCRVKPDVLTAEQAEKMLEGLAKAGFVVTRRGTIMPMPRNRAPGTP